MTPDDLTSFATISDPQLHPDGVRIAFVVSRMNFDDDRYDSTIWLWDGESTRQFTHGPVDARPRWSPDGDRLVLLRSSGEEGEGAQVAIMSAAGGEAEVITDFDPGAAEAEWSPDGLRLAVVATEWADGWKDLDDEERAKKPRRITAPLWRFDTLGYRHDRLINVYLLDPGGGGPTALTHGDRPADAIAWNPDGSAIGFLSARHDRAGFDRENQAWEVSVDGGEPAAIVSRGAWANLSYRPDGVAHVIGLEKASDYPASVGLYRVEEGRPVRLAADFDRNVVSTAPAPAPDGPQWLENGSCRLVAEDRGNLPIIEIAPDGSWHEVLGGRRFITGMTTRPDGSAMALTTTSVTDPGELAWFEAGEERTLTEMNAEFRAASGLVEPDYFVLDSGDVESGGVDLDVWVYLPPGDEQVPVLFNIHGGPATQYGWAFFDEFQVYASAGYGVVATNPRGASGRGRDFVRGALGRWNEERPPDVEDLLGALDGAIERFDRLDAECIGIMGGSYGGLITAKILATDHRFRSAVPERGLYNFASFAGTSDIGLWFGGLYVADRDYDDWSALWDASPLRTAHRITTPCLVIHSDADFRCPIEQGEQLFTVLIDNGVEAELLRMPGESHELSRSGTPTQRRDRFEAILEWHGRHLGTVD